MQPGIISPNNFAVRLVLLRCRGNLTQWVFPTGDWLKCWFWNHNHQLILGFFEFHSGELNLRSCEQHKKDEIVSFQFCQEGWNEFKFFLVSKLFSFSLMLYRSILKNTIFLVESTHSSWHISDMYLYLWSGFHAVSSWACVSGGYPAAREDGPVEQNCFCLPGDRFPISFTLLSFFVHFSLCSCSVFKSNGGLCRLLRSFRGLMTTLWYHMMSPLEQQAELCLRGTSAQHTAAVSSLFIFQLFYPFFIL